MSGSRQVVRSCLASALAWSQALEGVQTPSASTRHGVPL